MKTENYIRAYAGRSRNLTWMMLAFISIASLTVQAQIAIDGTGAYTNVTTVKSAIEDALSTGNTVTVTGSLTTASTLNIVIPGTKKVVWKASLIGSTSGNNPLLNINGGIFEVSTGGHIEQVGISPRTVITDSHITVSGGTVSNPNSIGYVIYSNAANSTVTVTDGTVIATDIGGYAIYASGADSKIDISGGTVSSTNTNGRAIYANGQHCEITVSGGTVAVSGNGGYAIYAAGADGTVAVSGGTVSATGNGGHAIYTSFSESKVAVNGGLVFAYAKSITGTGTGNVIVLTKSENLSVRGLGIVAGWDNKPTPKTYGNCATTDLVSLPENCATWDFYTQGIKYVNGRNTGDIKISGITVTPAIPIISVQPQAAKVMTGASGATHNLSVTASVPDDGTLSYQWYINTIPRDIYGTPIPDATAPTYAAPIDENDSYAYYYVTITNTLEQMDASVTSNVIRLTVGTFDLYDLTIYTYEGGKVTADQTDGIIPGETVTLTIIPDAGYELASIEVSSVRLRGEGNTRTFTMPEHHTSVRAVFREITPELAWDKAVRLIEDTAFVVTQKEVSTMYDFQYELAKMVNELIAETFFVISPYDIVIYKSTPAIEGDTDHPFGTDGLFDFRVTPPGVYSSAYSHGTITATYFDVSGNDDIPQSNQLKAWTQSNVLHVSGLTQGKPWYVYHLSGKLVFTGIATAEKVEIPLPERGIYILISNGKTVKTAITN